MISAVQGLGRQAEFADNSERLVHSQGAVGAALEVILFVQRDQTFLAGVQRHRIQADTLRQFQNARLGVKQKTLPNALSFETAVHGQSGQQGDRGRIA